MSVCSRISFQFSWDKQIKPRFIPPGVCSLNGVSLRGVADGERWAFLKERKQEDRSGKEVGLPPREFILRRNPRRDGQKAGQFEK